MYLSNFINNIRSILLQISYYTFIILFSILCIINSSIAEVLASNEKLNIKAIEQALKEDNSQKKEALIIETANARHSFQVEVMKDEKSRAQGLMFRIQLLQDQGMLFIFDKEQPVQMWMKNTYIPLDMLFIEQDGRIHRIENNAEPHSEEIISSGIPVSSVLEISGGMAEKLGIKAGDKVIYPVK